MCKVSATAVFWKLTLLHLISLNQKDVTLDILLAFTSTYTYSFTFYEQILTWCNLNAFGVICSKSAGYWTCTLLLWTNQTVAYMPDFMPLDLWPPNSLTSTQLTIRYGWVCRNGFYQTDIYSVHALKQQLIHLWCNPDRDIIDTAIDR